MYETFKSEKTRRKNVMKMIVFQAHLCNTNSNQLKKEEEEGIGPLQIWPHGMAIRPFSRLQSTITVPAFLQTKCTKLTKETSSREQTSSMEMEAKYPQFAFW
jgi:hypothetical protein